MGFSIYNLFKAGLLVANGAAILHPKRFLVKHGLAGDQIVDNPDPIKAQVAGLLQAISYLKGECASIFILHLITRCCNPSNLLLSFLHASPYTHSSLNCVQRPSYFHRAPRWRLGCIC